MARLSLWRHEPRSHLRDTSHVGQKRSQQGDTSHGVTGSEFQKNKEEVEWAVRDLGREKWSPRVWEGRFLRMTGREMMRKAECGLNKEHSGAVHLPGAFLRLCWEALHSWMNHARVGHPQTSSTLPSLLRPGLVPKKECLKAELPYTEGEDACSWGRHKNEGGYF